MRLDADAQQLACAMSSAGTLPFRKGASHCKLARVPKRHRRPFAVILWTLFNHFASLQYGPRRI